VTDFPGGQEQPIRVVRIIARLNIGGPAIQAITLTKRLEPLGYRTTLVRGTEEPDEGNMDPLADELGVRPLRVPSLRRNPGWHDLAALWSLIRIVWRERPDIVHTHAAKGGTLGRIAAVLASAPLRRRPVIVHTFHGQSLTGYFSSRRARTFLAIERILARLTDRLIAVSDEVRDDLVALGVASAERFEVVRLGFDLSPFQVGSDERHRRGLAVRNELGVPADARVVTLIARLVPIKRVDRFLRVAGRLADREGICFLVVGDGDLRDELRRSLPATALGARIIWTGFRHDIPDVCFASDVVVLTSDNEGTPVSLIEAQAAGAPVVSTRVGGVATVVLEGQTGFVVGVDDEQGMAQAVGRLLDDRELSARLGTAAAEHATTFSIDQLIERIHGLYRRLLATRHERPRRA
jgi:glycosyltransferase involved in cell wall biosynthesis